MGISKATLKFKDFLAELRGPIIQSYSQQWFILVKDKIKSPKGKEVKSIGKKAQASKILS